MNKRITFRLGEKLIAAAREYAQRHDTTVNDLIRKLLSEAVERAPQPAAGRKARTTG